VFPEIINTTQVNDNCVSNRWTLTNKCFTEPFIGENPFASRSGGEEYCSSLAGESAVKSIITIK
jgi:hypothetical protein